MGTLHSAISSRAGYSFTASGECYEVNSDGTIAGPFAANVPAITDEGYKARQSLTNVLLRSQEFDNSSWTKTNITVSANAVTDPLGTTTADTLDEGTATGSHRIAAVQQGTLQTSGQQTFSVFAKAGTASIIQLILDNVAGSNDYANFDLSTGTTGTVGASVTAEIIDCGSGWYRCSVTGTVDGSNAGCLISIADSTTMARVGSYAGTSRTVHLWQAQCLTAGITDGGPIIVTTAAAATRGEAVLGHSTFGDASAITSAAALHFWKIKPHDVTASGLTVAQHDDGTANNVIRIYLDAGVVTGEVIAGGVSQYSQTVAGALAINTEAWVGIEWDGTNFQVFKYVGGTTTNGSAGAGTFPTGLDLTRPGGRIAAGNSARATIGKGFIEEGTFDDTAREAAINGTP